MSATTPRTAVTLFQEYKLDFEAALEPCMMCMFQKCPEGEREKLDALLEAYYDGELPRAPYSPVQCRRIEEKMRPLFDRAMQDPGVMASEDQREALWRDTPRWRRAWLSLRFRCYTYRLRLKTVGRKPPWE